MHIRTELSVTHGPNAAALIRFEPTGETMPVFIVYFRVSYAGGARVEEWTRCVPEREDALELYRRGVDDFVCPVPYVPSGPETVSP